MGIMTGFIDVTEQQLRGVQPPITIRNPNGGYLQWEKIDTIIRKEFQDTIEHAFPNSVRQVIIQKQQSADMSNVVILHGVDVLNNSLLPLHQCAIQNGTSLPDLLAKNCIVMGKELARALDIQEGDVVTLLFMNEQQDDRDAQINMQTHTVTVTALLSTGIDDIDAQLCICSLDTIAHICPSWGITHISITPSKMVPPESLVVQLKDRFGLPTYRWQELYPSLFAALTLEYYVMIGIACLIMLIACMNSISLLTSYIIHKQKDIAIFRILGASNHDIQHIFIIMGVALSLCATLCGQMGAIFMGTLVDHYQLIRLPEGYYSSHLPIHIHTMHLITTLIISFMIAIIACYAAARRIKQYSTTSIIKHSL